MKRTREEAFLDDLLGATDVPSVKRRKTNPVKKGKKRALSPASDTEPGPPLKKYFRILDTPTPTSHQPQEEPEETLETEEDRYEMFRRKLQRTSDILSTLYNDVVSITNKLAIGSSPTIPTTLTKVLLKLKSFYKQLVPDFGGDIKKALMVFKRFWGNEQHEDLSTISDKDNFKKLFKCVLRYAHDLEFKVKQGIGKSLLYAKEYIKTLKAIKQELETSKQDSRYITIVESKITAVVDILTGLAGFGARDVDENIEVYESLYDLERMIPVKLRGLGKDLQKIDMIPICNLKYTFIERGIQPNTYIYVVSGRAGYSFRGKEHIRFSKTESSREKQTETLFDYSIVKPMLEDSGYTDTLTSMQEYIANYKIFEKLKEDDDVVLPFDIADEALKRDPTAAVPLTVTEIMELANYQTPIDGEPIYSEEFYKHYKRRIDSNQEIEPGMQVVILGNYECPPMDLKMAVKMRNCVTTEEMEVAKKTMDLVVDHIDYGHNGKLLVVDMAKAPKNRYREFLSKSECYYHHLYQWFITINPNMTQSSMATSVRGEGLINTKEEFYEVVKNTFSTYIPEWLIHNKRPLDPEKVRSWKIEEMKEESGGGAGRISHIHLLLSVSVISEEDLERSVNLSYTEINKYFQSIRKQTYFNCSKVNTDRNGLLDSSTTNRQRVLDYINKGEKAPPKYNFSKFSKPKDNESP